MKIQKHIVIVGTGLAGYMLAKEYRQYNANTTLTFLTKSDGTFYSKPLLSSALTQQRTPEQLSINTADEMRSQLNAGIVTHAYAFKIDAKNKTVFYKKNNAENSVSYDQLVLAMGATPIQSEFLSVNQLEDYREFRQQLKNKKHITIVGTGLVGCEFANDLANIGIAVTMRSLDAYPLAAFVPESVGNALRRALEKLNVQFCFHVPATEKPSSDFVLSAIGIKSDLLLATSVGLKTNKGIVVNAQLQTSDQHIFALGDCAEINGRLHMHIAPILHEARVLARVLNGESTAVSFGVMPILVKTPACPIVVVAPVQDAQGEWHVTESGNDITALFIDKKATLKGFALSGAATREKMRLIKQMAAL